VDACRREFGQELSREDVAGLRDEVADARANGVQHLVGRGHARAIGADPGLSLHLQAADTHLEELVEASASTRSLTSSHDSSRFR
jgi:hypothetical protein